MNRTDSVNASYASADGTPALQQTYAGSRLLSGIDHRVEEELRPLNADFHSTLRKRLRENGRALKFLAELGLDKETVEYFGLGLSAPYTNRNDNRERADALVYPLRDRGGNF